MSAGDLLLRAVCGGGGNDILAFLVVLVIGGFYATAVVYALSRAEDGGELALLVSLLIATITIGGILFLYPEGIEGNGDYLGRFVLSFVISGLLGIGVVVKRGEEVAGRALFIALAGDVLIPGGLFVFLFSSLGVGTGCLS